MESIEHIILLLISGQGLLVSLALVTSIYKKKYSNFCLGLISTVFTIEILNIWAMRVAYHSSENPFPFWTLGSYLIIPPALWLFLKVNTTLNFKLRAKHSLLFLPAITEIVVEFSKFYLNSVFIKNINLTESTFWYLFTEIAPIIATLLLIIYFFIELQKLKSKLKQTVRIRDATKNLQRLYVFFSAFTVLTVLWILIGIFQLQIFSIIEVMLLIFMFVIGYVGLFNPAYFNVPKSKALSNLNENYSQYDNEKELQRLKKLFEESEIYIQPKLTLKDVASHLKLPPRYVSELINYHYNTNFNTYVNSFRVSEVIKRINNPKEKNKTLLGIALECGFNSKSSFNQIFKSQTGKSPSDFLKAK